MKKSYLNKIQRRFDYQNKSNYDYVLNQSERTTHIAGFQKFLQTINQEDLFFYPNTKKFKQKICNFYGVNDNQLYLCDGSDSGIKTIFESLTDKGRVITSEPSFPMYKVYSDLYGCEYFGIPHEQNYTISIEKILSNITHETDLIILANPNSPMGEYKLFDEILHLLKFDIPILIDEAYIEFTGNESFVKYIDEYPNLLVTRTFSKGFGAAGCRVGMVFGDKKNIELISKFRQMYEISGISMKYCEYLLDNYDIVDSYIQDVVNEKNKIVSLMNDYDVIDSNCNWIHFNNEIDNVDVIRIFEKNKVLVKYCKIPNDDRNNWCRMTIQPNITDEKFMRELI